MRTKYLATALAGALALSLPLAPAYAAPAVIAPSEANAIIVTEIAPDNASYDNYEFFEVTNASTEPIDLATSGHTFAYTYVDSDDTTRDVPMTLMAGETAPVLDPGESAVYWLNYTTSTVDSYVKTLDDFRAATNMTADVPLVRIEGQSGMANGGNRGIRVLKDGAIQNWSFYPSGSAGVDQVVTFGLPESGESMRVVETLAPYSPGVIDAAKLEIPTPATEPTTDPSTDPTTDPTTEPTTDPSEPAGPQAPTTSAPLIVTEAVVDSSNVNSADGYEFIEIANATDSPVDFENFKVRYLYPIDEQTNSSSVVWDSIPADVVIPSGETLTFWIKNGKNDHLTAADFNTFYGANLEAGTELVEIYQGGMANGSKRGLQIETNTGIMINRAYYNMGDTKDVQTDRGLKWFVDPADLLKQTLAGSDAPTPGTVDAGQVPDPLVTATVDTVAPVIVDETADSVATDAPFPISFTVTDNEMVRTATLTVSSSAPGDARVVNLVADGDRYSYEIPMADLTGKRWFEYSLTVTDGFNEVSTETVRVNVDGANTDPVRLNYSDGDWVRGTTDVIAATDSPENPATITVDGAEVETTASLESFPTFAMEVSQTDAYFRNGVLAGGDVLKIFDRGTYANIETLSTPVSTSYIDGDKLVVSVYAGTKAAPEIDPNENNDDFQIRALRLILPDGRALTPEGYDDPSQWLKMGDSAGKLDFYDAVFTIPSDAYTGQSYTWDTTSVDDGEHALAASAGSDSDSATVRVDNTAPLINITGVEDGELAQGRIVLSASATDHGIGLENLSATLDGKIVDLPVRTSSLEMAAGEHTFSVRVVDKLGNEATAEVTFEVPVEMPASGGYAPANGAAVPTGDVPLSAEITDVTGDIVDVTFLRGVVPALDSADVRTSSGTVADAGTEERETARELTAAEVDALAKVDGVVEETVSNRQFPYRLFEVDVTDLNSRMRVQWDGSSEADSQVSLLAKRSDGTGWDEVDRQIVLDGEPFTLEALVNTPDYVENGTATFLVQHSDGYAGQDRTTRDSAITPYHAEDKLRSDYDFTLAWESDTQYYNETWYEHQVAIHDYILANRDDMNIQYVFHTGDIVDESDKMYQWENADPQYARFDEAGLPYGVLAGNHDVAQQGADYTNYYQYFGADRFENNPWYGDSYANNRGHYDLISAGGIDFMVVSMGWGIGDEQIDWMNDVIAAHPDRVVIINVHEFMLTTGGLGPIPQRILNEVAATNPNVRMIMSGHYHDAHTRTDSFDDDGDGTADRTVTSLLFDYQGLPEGGQGFLRLMHFDNAGAEMHVRTFSPSLDQYNSEDPSLTYTEGDRYRDQDFQISYEQLGIEPAEYTLATDAFRAEVLTQKVIGAHNDLATPATAETVWADREAGEHSWYVRALDEHGAESLSPVLTFTADPALVEPEPGDGDPIDPVEPVDPSTEDPTDPADPGQGGDGGSGGDGGNGGGETPADPTEQIGGRNRIQTSVMALERLASEQGGLDSLVLAGAYGVPDMLSGTPLAESLDTAVAFTLVDSLSPEVANLIREQGISKVTVLGGTNAVSEQVVQDLAELGVEVERIAGRNRYATSVAIANKMIESAPANDPIESIVFATGNDMADALVSGPLAAKKDGVVVLTRGEEFSDEAARFVFANIRLDAYSVGGPAARATKSIGLSNAAVYAGRNRFETAAGLVNAEFRDADLITLANGVDGVDAAVAGPYAAMHDTGVLLTRRDAIPAVTAQALARYDVVKVFGGSSVISPAIMAALMN